MRKRKCCLTGPDEDHKPTCYTLKPSQQELYPECEKLAKISNLKQAIEDFLDWASDEHSVHLARPAHAGYYSSLEGSRENFLMDYFGIDTKELERERRKMLEGA